MPEITSTTIEHDFQRQLYCILGMPIDAIDMKTTMNVVQNAVQTRTPCFFSTPNLNFLIESLTDFSFTDSILKSDLSVADGRPIVWLGKLLGIPLNERVAGSSLFEKLIKSTSGNPIKVFFFGGQGDTAEQAMHRVNQISGGIICVGALNPGMGTVEDMSQEKVIDQINLSKADFVVVSLGARKGQAWILNNRNKLDAPIISHLGAVVNFIAGSIRRAPIGWQKAGFEWLWRIKEEPYLWRRYWRDGSRFTKIVFFQLLPHLWKKQRLKRSLAYSSPPEIKIHRDQNEVKISLSGNLTTAFVDPYRNDFAEIAGNVGNTLELDLSEAAYIDEGSLGILLLLEKHMGKRFRIVASSNQTRILLDFNNMERLYSHVQSK